MTNKQKPFEWIIVEGRLWPPHGRPRAPFGPTTLEVMRSCPLRACFEASHGYERRMSYSARIGAAFHRTLQSLSEDPPTGASAQDIASEARVRFAAALQAQESLRTARPREQGMPRDEIRVQRATEAVIVEAQRLWSSGQRALPRRMHYIANSAIENTADQASESASVKSEELAGSSSEVPDAAPEIGLLEVEVDVQSSDGMLVGRIDCAEHTENGIRLLDFKSALRDDVPERYERQLQLYALLWYETRGQWPVTADLVYPFTAASHPVNINPTVCRQIETESRGLIEQVKQTSDPSDLAMPGDVCTVCEFRPWCRPFWIWQADERMHMRALERAVLGFEGQITQLQQVSQHWKLTLRWRNCLVQLVAPIERFLQLEKAYVGMVIRVLDARLHGQMYRPQVIVTESTEIFLVE